MNLNYFRKFKNFAYKSLHKYIRFSKKLKILWFERKVFLIKIQFSNNGTTRVIASENIFKLLCKYAS